MRVVLVDPSKTVRHIVSDLIVQDLHEVQSFADGQQALECIKANADVHALITCGEPNSISGIELCWQARAIASDQRPLYIILMSSLDDKNIRVQALDSGADDFIHKPPDLEELRARMRVADRVTRMQQELIRQATTDSLTGLLNRRAFFERAKEACNQAMTGKPLSAIMVDIDHFKTVNDVYGHQVGDDVIRGVAAEASATGRLVGRLGGEEFCALILKSMLDAVDLAEELRHAVSILEFGGKGDSLGVTCSFGVAEWENGDTIDQLLRRADMALYEAKAKGRNRVVASDTYAISKHHEEWLGVTRTGKSRRG